MNYKNKVAVAYGMGKARVRLNLAIILGMVNILLMIMGDFKVVGLNTAVLLIVTASLLTNISALRTMEKESGLSEEDIVKELETTV